MVILGIDPGLAIVGWGVIEYSGNRFHTLAYGAIRTPAGMETPKRLLSIRRDMEELLKKYKPQHMAVEELFFNQNITTAITVGQARGVVLLCCAKRNIPVFEYTPLQSKQALVGYGRADKKQMQQMVKVFLGLPEVPKPDDAADALAMAICHAHHYQTKRRSGYQGD